MRHKYLKTHIYTCPFSIKYVVVPADKAPNNITLLSRTILIQTKNSLQLTLSRCLISWLTTYLLRSEDVVFNRLSAFIPMRTNCTPFLVDLFLFYYEAYYIQNLLTKKDKKLAISVNFPFRYIHDVLSINNSKFGDYVERIYTIKLEIKDTTDTVKSASYLDWHLEIDNVGRLKTKLYDERDDISFPITFYF